MRRYLRRGGGRRLPALGRGRSGRRRRAWRLVSRAPARGRRLHSRVVCACASFWLRISMGWALCWARIIRPKRNSMARLAHLGHEIPQVRCPLEVLTHTRVKLRFVSHSIFCSITIYLYLQRRNRMMRMRSISFRCEFIEDIVRMQLCT